ncbi:MAG: hypothetical protein JWM80_5099, partial [Cyanobacteria bacterium RYN_339]|nr:hypothetical protein [Cyanobacteria bacterium RYN_339]
MRLVISLAAVALAFLTGAADAVTKAAQTPCFCQKDPSFEKDGANYCAPTAVSDGLIYLARARNLVGLVPGTDHAGQVQLIKALAEHMETDPDDGTPPGRVIEGLESYVEARGYKLRQLEVATWRPVGDHAKIAAKPDLDWMRKVAAAPDTVVM